ncbi:MAG: tetratricopeptide repeat protein [Nodosilinea sp.]
MTAVISLNSQTFLGHNQETYQDLRLALQVNLRRQLLIAVCDNVALQGQLVARLEADLSPYPARAEVTPALRATQSPIVTLRLDSGHPDLVREVLLWLKQQRLLQGVSQTIPAFQILGIETLLRQSPTVQNRFLASLIRVDALLTQLDCRLLVWVPRPWLGKIRQSVPGFWRSRSALFEFAGDPSLDKGEESRQKAGGQALEGELPPSRTDDGSAGEVSQPGADSAQLWTILREDLSEFERRTVPPHPAEVEEQPTVLPDVTAPAPVPHPNPGSAAATTGMPALGLPGSWLTPNQVTVFNNEALTTVVMPPLGGVLGEALEDLLQIEPPQSCLGDASTNPQDAFPGSDFPGATHSPAGVEEDVSTAENLSWPQLPPGFVEDAEMVTLWRYGQTLASQQAGPLTLARVYLALGQLGRDRIETASAPAAPLDFTIDLYHRALAGLPRGTPDWGDALNDLASLYWLRSQQETAPAATMSWLNRSVEAYQQALAGCPTAPADTLGRIYSNLGTVYGLLADFAAPLPCLEQSVRAYHQALQHLSAQQSPLDYANLQNSLGAVHWRLAQLDRPQHHLHRAIAAYSEALHQRSPQTAPLEYAMAQNNLGIAYWSLAQHERPVFLLEQAIAAYSSALAYRTLATTPAGCAATHNNLGTAHWDLAQHYVNQPERRMAALRQAVAAYEAALDAAERALQQSPAPALGFDIWATFHSAGVVHDQIAQALPVDELENRRHHLREALQHYLLAYQGWQNDPPQLDILVTALVYTVHLNFEILGLAGQQAALAQLPGELLPQILPQL